MTKKRARLWQVSTVPRGTRLPARSLDHRMTGHNASPSATTLRHTAIRAPRGGAFDRLGGGDVSGSGDPNAPRHA